MSYFLPYKCAMLSCYVGRGIDKRYKWMAEYIAENMPDARVGERFRSEDIGRMTVYYFFSEEDLIMFQLKWEGR
ncbi:MAG TPA: hypothetical protein VFM18_18000 [Methanosarcina sp.]|nr:hypothetical protein [Methanosarcina sp.]